jgi:hypothetical protein
MRACPAGNGKGACARHRRVLNIRLQAVAPRGHRCDAAAEAKRGTSDRRLHVALTKSDIPCALEAVERDKELGAIQEPPQLG